MAASLKQSLAIAALAAGALAVAPRAEAQIWTRWTTISNAGGEGTIGLPGGPVDVTVTGNTIGGELSSTGTFYWNPASTWSGVSGTSPDNPGLIRLDQGTTLTVHFSTPVDLYMALISVGQAPAPQGSITYSFDSPFSIVSQGPSSSWGGCNTCLVQTGNSVTGTEGDGTLHFAGPVQDLTITTTPNEYWHGFTFGAQVTTTPEPASMVLLATGLAGVFGAARRKRQG